MGLGIIRPLTHVFSPGNTHHDNPLRKERWCVWLAGVLYNDVPLCVRYLCSGRVLETQGDRGVVDCVCVCIEEEGQCYQSE